MIIETETHFVDTENLLYRTKVDLFKKSGQLVGFRLFVGIELLSVTWMMKTIQSSKFVN